jgi:hypothetical protein
VSKGKRCRTSSCSPRAMRNAAERGPAASSRKRNVSNALRCAPMASRRSLHEARRSYVR